MKKLRESLKILIETKEFTVITVITDSGATETYSGSISAYNEDKDQFTLRYDSKLKEVYFTPKMVETLKVNTLIYSK